VQRYKVDGGDYTSVAAARTVLQVNLGATRRIKIIEIGFSGASVTSTDAPVLVEVGTETSAGTSVAFTPLPLDVLDPAAISAALNTFSGAEPTGFAAVGLGPWRVTPIGGLIVYQAPNGGEFVAAVSTRIAIRITPAASVTTALRPYLIFQE
jgi:hypothetical protein